jgi:hypothetical protein
MWDETIQELEECKTKQNDIIVKANQLTMNNAGQLLLMEEVDSFNPIGKETPINVTDWMLSQVANKLKIPVKYLQRCQAPLRAINVNAWLSVQGAKEYKIRLDPNGGRAFLSPKFVFYDDLHLLPTVRDELSGVNCEIDIYRIATLKDKLTTHIRGYFPDISVNMGNGQGDKNYAGFHIVNSEVGAAGVRVEVAIWREVCSNGLVVKTNGFEALWQKHIHVKPEEINYMVAKAIKDAPIIAESMFELLTKARNKNVYVAHRLEKLVEEKKLSKAFAEEASENIEENTVYGLVNAITRQAQELNTDHRVQVERFAGRLLTRLAA